MSPRVPDEGKPREKIRSTRLGPDDDATMKRRMTERGTNSVSTYLRALVREDGSQKGKPRRG